MDLEAVNDRGIGSTDTYQPLWGIHPGMAITVDLMGKKFPQAGCKGSASASGGDAEALGEWSPQPHLILYCCQMAQRERTRLQYRRRRLNPWVRKILWRKKWQPTEILLPGESPGQRSLAGYSLWCRRVRHDWAHMHRHAGTQVSAVTLGVCHELQGTRAFSAALVTFQQMARLLSQALTALIFSFAPPCALWSHEKPGHWTTLLITIATIVTKCRCLQPPGQALWLLWIPSQAMTVRKWETQRSLCCLIPWPFFPVGYPWALQICEHTQSRDSPLRVSFLVRSGSNAACANMSLVINGLYSWMWVRCRELKMGSNPTAHHPTVPDVVSSAPGTSGPVLLLHLKE